MLLLFESGFAGRLLHDEDETDPITGDDNNEWVSACGALAVRENGQYLRALRHTSTTLKGRSLLAHRDAVALALTTHLLLPLSCMVVEYALPTPLSRAELDTRRLQWWTQHLPLLISRPYSLAA